MQIGHVDTGLHFLRVDKPLDERVKIVGENSRGQRLAVGQMRQIGADDFRGAGSVDRVTVDTRARGE